MLKSHKRAKQTPKRLPPIKGYTEQNSAPQTLNYSPIVTRRDPILDDSRTSQQLAMEKQGNSRMTMDQREIRIKLEQITPANRTKERMLPYSKTPNIDNMKVYSGWNITAKNITDDQEKTIKEQLDLLRSVEQKISKMDKYVWYTVQKYQPFIFNIKQFLNDMLIGQTRFVQDHYITNGEHQGSFYWGQHLGQSIDTKFVPHGFGILVDKHNKVMQIGTFKQGKENGQQRII